MNIWEELEYLRICRSSLKDVKVNGWVKMLASFCLRPITVVTLRIWNILSTGDWLSAPAIDMIGTTFQADFRCIVIRVRVAE